MTPRSSERPPTTRPSAGGDRLGLKAVRDTLRNVAGREARPRCAACRRPILPGSAVRIHGKRFHRDCLHEPTGFARSAAAELSPTVGTSGPSSAGPVEREAPATSPSRR